MTSPADLSTRDRAVAWLSGNPPVDSAQNPLIDRLITSASRFILTECARTSIVPTTYTDLLDGADTDRIMLRRYPVTAVTALNINGSAIAAAPALSSGNASDGYVFQQWDGIPPGRAQLLYYRGGYFPRGKQNIGVTFSCGYLVANEMQAVSGSANPEYSACVAAPYGHWSTDKGVTYSSNGSALTPVASEPVAGQYAVQNGVYQFAAADVNASVLISYGFIPADLEEACIELVGERYRAKGRIGVTTESQGGHVSTSFSQKDMSAFVATLIEPYKSVLI